MQLDLPLQNAGAGGGGFSLGHVAGMLQRNGEGSVGQGVMGSKRGEGEGGGDGLLEAAGVAQSADEAVMRLDVRRVGGDGGAEGLDRFGWGAGSEQIEPALGKGFGSWSAGLGHDSL